MAGHGPEKTGKTFSDFTAGGFRWIVQGLCRFMHPGKSGLHTRPQRGSFVQAAIYQTLQAVEFFREPLFSATRSRLSEMVARRRCSFSPDASKGGRPSSVIELRTAAQ